MCSSSLSKREMSAVRICDLMLSAGIDASAVVDVVVALLLPPVAAVGLPLDCLSGVEVPGALEVVFLGTMKMFLF